MPSRRFLLFLILILGLGSFALMQTTTQTTEEGLIAGRNVNAVGGINPYTGNPNLQKQCEPTLDFSTRNPFNVFVAFNDYRTVEIDFPEDDVPGVEGPAAPARDAWIGWAQSTDGGGSYTSLLLPGFPQDNSPEGQASPLKQMGFRAAADPVAKFSTNGLLLLAGIAFNRDLKNGNVVFVSRFIDYNNNESEGSIKYVDTNVWNTAESDVFFDKPWLEVDSPHGVGQRVTIDGQSIPKSNVYLAYAGFKGVEVATQGFTGINQIGLTSQIYFQRSTDCGQTWDLPVVLDSGRDINQGVSIAVDPRNNEQILLAWRTFGYPYDSIMAAISTNGGVDFDRVVEVATFPSGPFDQPTTETMFRHNTYPSTAIDYLGNNYIICPQRGMGPNGEARVMIYTSPDGLNWSAAQRVDSPADQLKPGYQFYPSMSVIDGQVMVAWYDQRYDVVQHDNYGMFGDPFIREIYPLRHTVDVRVAMAEPSLAPVFSDSIQVSRYQWAFVGGQAIQLKYNKPGEPIYNQGIYPFIGDYMAIAGGPRFVPNGNGWKFNVEPNPTKIHMAAWTDNRDVLGDNLAFYTSPLNPDCNPNLTGSRNQNVYTARISQGIIAGSPGNTKPLNIKRAFVVQAKNTTAFDKTVTFEIDPLTVPTARFWEAGSEYDSLTRVIPPYSSFATTVLVEPYSSLYELVYVNILENGSIVSQVMLNPDPTNPEIEDPYSDDPTLNPHIVNDEVHTPHIVNWTYEEVDPSLVYFDPENPYIVNSDMVTPHIVNTDLENPHIVNETINPHIVNPHIVNVSPDSSGTDFIYTVQNGGNTTSSYSLGTYPADVPSGILVQILVYKIYTTPTALGCELNSEEHHELVVNHTNPHIVNVGPAASIQEKSMTLQENEDVWDVHFSLDPGEQAHIVYRVYNPDPDSLQLQDPLVPKIISDIANVTDGNLGQMPAYPLLIVTTSIEGGIVGEPFTATVQSYGGTGIHTWALLGAPSGMSIDADGVISWTPDAVGIYDFAVQVSDEGDPQQVYVQNLSLQVVANLEITTSALNDGVVDQSYPGTQISATGGTGNYTWSLDDAPTWMSIDQNGMIYGNADPNSSGTFSVTIRVTDSGPPLQTNALTLEVNIADPLEIATASLPNGVNGGDYTATVQAQGGVGIYTWALVDPPAWLSIDSSTGVLSGTPTGFFEQFDITVQVWDEFTPDPLTVTKTFTIVIYDILAITTESSDLDEAYVGTPYSETLGAIGGMGPFIWGLTEGSAPLPSGLALGSDGVIGGEPVFDPLVTYPEPYTFEVYVQDAFTPFQRVTKALTITVNPKEAFWAVFPETGGETEANAITTDAEGNVYVVGKITLNGGTASDLYIAKYFNSGALDWEEIIDGGNGGNDEAEAIAVDSAIDSTGIYVTGYITGANGDADIFLIKFDSTGHEEWRQVIDGGYGDDKASAIAVKNGVVCITGFSTGKTSGEDYHTVAYSTAGEWLWDAGFDGPAHQGDFANALVITDSGKVIVTGSSFRGNKQNGHLDYQTNAYDSLGELIWEARYDGKENGDDEALALCVDPLDNVYVSGRSELSKKKIKDFDYYTIKYDAAGEVVWDVRYDSGFGNDEAFAMAIDESGLYVTGFDTGEFSGSNYYTVKYDLADGHVLNQAWHDADNGEDRATGLVLDSTGLYVTGWSKPGSAADFDIYTVKYSTSLEEILWETWYDGGDSDDFAVAIVKSIGGDVYVTGIIQTGLTTSMVTLKY